MFGKKILVVDDEQNIRLLLKDFLESDGFCVIEATNGKAALDTINSINGNLDIVLLDIMLPVMDGYTVCKEIKKKYNIPVVILSARNEDLDEAHGFQIGADDYVSKPIKPTSLVARLNALLQRMAKQDVDKEVFSFDGLYIDNESHTVMVDGEEIELRRKEYDLLLLLVKNKGKVISRETLMNQIWGYEFFGGERTVDTHINRLRSKLGRISKYIITIRSYGYKFGG